MICYPCRDTNHDLCIKKNGERSTWCDCQHYAGTAINTALVKAADVGVGSAEE